MKQPKSGSLCTSVRASCKGRGCICLGQSPALLMGISGFRRALSPPPELLSDPGQGTVIWD